MQTRKTRDRILAVAEERGELHRLVWVVMQQIPRDGEYGTAIRGSLVTLPTTPSVEESSHYAHLMMEILRQKYPKDRTFWLEVRATEDLDAEGITWHNFSEIDFVCPGCAAIGNDCVCEPTVRRIESEIAHATGVHRPNVARRTGSVSGQHARHRRDKRARRRPARHAAR